MNDLPTVEIPPHHSQLEFCYTRAKYRQGRQLTSVKAYTVNDESKYLVLSGVPAIKIQAELERLCLRYGHTEMLKIMPDYPQEEFAEAFLVKYSNIKNARFAKIKLDGKSFYGGVLHVFYAPELETPEETREKLADRRKSIAALTRYKQDASEVNKTKPLDKKQIQSVAMKRCMSQMREDVLHTYQKIFQSNSSDDKESSINVNVDATVPMTNSKIPTAAVSLESDAKESSINVNVDATVPVTNSKIPTAAVSLESDACTRTWHAAYDYKSTSTGDTVHSQGSPTSLPANVNNSSVSVPCKRSCRTTPSVPQSSKKIKLFKNAKILSYQRKEENK